MIWTVAVLGRGGNVGELDLQIDYVDRLRQWIGPASRILDYGCGYGRALGILQSKGCNNLIGVDPAPAMIDAARRGYPTISFEVLDEFRNVGLPDASMDAVLLLTVLYISDMWLPTDARNVERYERDQGNYSALERCTTSRSAAKHPNETPLLS